MEKNDEKVELEEYLSQVRHDIRVHLTVLSEGMSMVVDGLGNKDCEKCCSLLKVAMEHAQKVNKLLESTLSSSALKEKVSELTDK